MENRFEQEEKSAFFKHLDVCCQQIAEKVGSADVSEWKNSDYIKLSALLYRQTKVAISENTLKRIFGKLKTSVRYYPQKATRDALAQFIGYRDWYEFELVNAQTNTNPQPMGSTAIPAAQQPTPKRKFKLSNTAVIGLVLIGLTVVWYFYNKSSTVPNVKLICINPEGKTPHSAIFKLSKDINKQNLADFSIRFGDSKSPAHFSGNRINHYYETPGRYFPVLYHRGTPIDTVSVYLRSDGWSTITSLVNDTTRVYPLLLPYTPYDRKPNVNMIDVFKAGIDTNRTFFLSYAYVKPTPLSADNFELDTYVKTSPDRAGVRCSQVDLVIYGEQDNHSLMLIKPACVAWSYCKFSENNRYGSKDDLRQLGHNLSNGGKVKLKIADKNVQLFVNDSLVMTSSYQRSVGSLMGISLTFAGIGSFDNLKITDLKTGKLFSPKE